MHPDVEPILAELDGHRERFEAFCRSLTPGELARPVPRSSWLVRNFIAHLATIDGPVMEMFAAVHAGRDAGLRDGDGGRWDVDTWNEKRVQERRDATVEELLAEAAEIRARLRDVMAEFTDRDLAHQLHFGGDAKRPAREVELVQYLRGWSKHDPMHALDMLRAMPERMSPELERWFDDPIIAGYQAAMNRDG